MNLLKAFRTTIIAICIFSLAIIMLAGCNDQKEVYAESDDFQSYPEFWNSFVSEEGDTEILTENTAEPSINDSNDGSSDSSSVEPSQSENSSETSDSSVSQEVSSDEVSSDEESSEEEDVIIDNSSSETSSSSAAADQGPLWIF